MEKHMADKRQCSNKAFSFKTCNQEKPCSQLLNVCTLLLPCNYHMSAFEVPKDEVTEMRDPCNVANICSLLYNYKCVNITINQKVKKEVKF